MIQYKEYEQKVFDWLSDKNFKDPNFTFSLRMKGSKGAETDYFIGTEKSRYFGMTFWTIPVWFPGSSGDCIDLIFQISANYTTYSYNFEFTQTNSPEEGQNTSILRLIKSLITPLDKAFDNSYVSPSDNKMCTIRTKSKKNKYSNLDEMLADIDEELDMVIAIVDDNIEKEMLVNPDFMAHRISQKEFLNFKQKLDVRLKKYESTNIINEDNLKKEFTRWLDKNYNGDSGAKNSYLRAIDMISEVVGYNIFKVSSIDIINKLYEDLLKNQRDKDGIYYNEKNPSYGLKGFYSASINQYKKFLLSRVNKDKKNKSIDIESYVAPLNQIFYGPPGTGKTYNTILKSAEIIESRTINSYEEALDIFKNNLHNRIEFITFHQNYSYEDFIQGLRPETDNKSTLVFEKKDGIFKKIADRALENLRLSEKAPSELTNEAQFNEALEKFKDIILDKEDNYKINDTAFIFEVEEDAFRYTGEKWANHANGSRMKFNDLREFYKKNVRSRKDIKKLKTISGLANQHATYFYLVYEQILKHIPKKIESPQRIEKQNYVIIIDEINRANISRVFGELITLIEPDKRSHGKIPLEAKLPSGDLFMVPSNLYIIGTMNTADKSIALLDIALRRRFDFVSMYPKYDIENQTIYDIAILKKINEQIIKSKGHDFQIGHAYFMGENKDLVTRMNKKVIPLLLEYYMNDKKEVESILNIAGLKVEKESWPLRITGEND